MRMSCQRTVAAVAIALVVLSVPAAAGEKTRGAARPTATGKSVLPFIEDDYAGALAQARAKKLPLFVEAWAPW